MINLVCEQCRKIYKAKPYMAKKSIRHFCSFRCYGKWQTIHRIGFGRKRVKIICNWCKKFIEKQPSTVKIHNFCDKNCFHTWQKETDFMSGENNPSWLGGHSQYRGKNWEMQRNLALKRDKHICQKCGKSAEIVHHIRPYHLFKDYKEANKLDNLITLCDICHGIEEIKFYKDNPNLNNGRHFPHLVPIIKKCEKCGSEFIPKTAKIKWCNKCRIAKCLQCGKEFLNTRYRKVKYCSKECRNKYLDTHAKWKRKCAICKKKIASGRYFCKNCFLKHIKPSSNLYQTLRQKTLENT